MTSPSSVHDIFDRRLLRLRRDRAAVGISGFDFLSSAAAQGLFDRLGDIKKAFPRVLDMGAGHGSLTALVQKRAGTQQVFSSDLSFNMARKAHAPRVVADEEFLPFGAKSFDAVVSNLCLQWANDLPGVLLQVRNILKPDGAFLAALIGGESLHELRFSLTQAESDITGGASPRVAPFVDVRDMGGLLQRAGFALPVVDLDTITVDYADFFKLLRDLRGMGATNVLRHRLSTPTRRAVLMEAARIYQEKFSNGRGGVTATFQILYLIGWAPHDSQQQPLKPGSATVRLAEALQTKEVPIPGSRSENN